MKLKFKWTKEDWKSLGVLAIIWLAIFGLVWFIIWFTKTNIPFGG
jgi:hypothetical protein